MLIIRYDSEFENNIYRNSGLFPKERYPDLQKEIEVTSPPTESQITAATKSLGDLWDGNKEAFFDSIKEFFETTKEQLPTLPEITVYLTRLPKYPYNFKGDHFWFAAPLDSNPFIRLKVAVHELTHFYFFKLGWGKFMKEKGFSDKAIDDVKEITATILVNTSYQKFLQFVHEKGHDRNKEFRDYVSKNAKDPENLKMKEIMQLTFAFYNVS